IVAYHEPVSRAEIEAIRGVQTSSGTLDVLMEAGWVRVAGRREGPGRPVIYATTPEFLSHFGLGSRRDLPGNDELKAPGLLDPAPELALGDDGMEAKQASDPAPVDVLENPGESAYGSPGPTRRARVIIAGSFRLRPRRGRGPFGPCRHSLVLIAG